GCSRDQEPALLAAPRERGNQLGIERHDAAVLGKRLFARWEWTVLYFIPFEDGLGLQKLFDMTGIVYAGKLNEKFGFRIATPGGLNRIFHQSQAVDLTLDGARGLCHGVVF